MTVESRYGGVEYFLYQLAASAGLAEIEAQKFARFVNPSDSVLDFGCGNGAILARLACAHKIGIELNPLAGDSAAARGIECYTSLELVPDQSVDVIISNHALEHLSNPLKVLIDMRRKLRRGGRLILCVPIDDWRSAACYDPQDPNGHLYTWTIQTLGNLLTAAGFVVREQSVGVLTEALPGPVTPRLYRNLPRWMFRLTTWCFAVLRKRRQLLAVVIEE